MRRTISDGFRTVCGKTLRPFDPHKYRAKRGLGRVGGFFIRLVHTLYIECMAQGAGSVRPNRPKNPPTLPRGSERRINTGRKGRRVFLQTVRKPSASRYGRETTRERREGRARVVTDAIARETRQGSPTLIASAPDVNRFSKFTFDTLGTLAQSFERMPYPTEML